MLRSPGPSMVLVGLFLALLALFHGAQGLDVAATRLFFAPDACPPGTPVAAGAANFGDALVCGQFPLAHSALARLVREGLQVLPIAAAVGVAALLLFRYAIGVVAAGYRTYRAGLDALASLLLGPGLLVNVILKDHWGRPRPLQTDLFGGPHPFVPAGDITAYCSRNCSFVSGEGAAAFWLVCLVPLAPPRLRPALLALTLALAAATSTLRLSFGAHYLSDVVLAGIATLAVHALVAFLAPLERRRRTGRGVARATA